MFTVHCQACGVPSRGLRLCARCGRRLTRAQVAERLKQIVAALAAAQEAAEGVPVRVVQPGEAYARLLLPPGR